MPVPTSFDDLSETPSSNSPQGSEPVGTQANEYIQTAFAFIKQLYDGFTPLNTLTAPVGTRLVMQQAAAPAGWTIDTASSFTDAAIRFNQTVGSGGANAFSAAFVSGSVALTTGSTAITTAQMPSHSHGISDPGHAHGVSDPGHAHGVNDPGHAHTPPAGAFLTNASSSNVASQGGAYAAYNTTAAAQTGISIAGATTGIGIAGATTGISGTQNAGSGQGHTHSFGTALNVKYADVIVAIKS